MSKPDPEKSEKCPICGKPTEVRYRPFCSKHCADVDLYHWLSGSYAIPAEDGEVPDEDEENLP